MKKNEEGKNKKNYSQGDLNIIKDKNLENENINKKMETINIKKSSSPNKLIIKNI